MVKKASRPEMSGTSELTAGPGPVLGPDLGLAHNPGPGPDPDPGPGPVAGPFPVAVLVLMFAMVLNPVLVMSW